MKFLKCSGKTKQQAQISRKLTFSTIFATFKMNFDILDTRETKKLENFSFSCSEVNQLLLSCDDNY